MGRRKVDGVDLRSPGAAVFSQPPLPLLGLAPEPAGGGARAARLRTLRPRCPSALRELTRSLGIYHAPNYNVNWQVPEIN